MRGLHSGQRWGVAGSVRANEPGRTVRGVLGPFGLRLWIRVFVDQPGALIAELLGLQRSFFWLRHDPPALLWLLILR